MLIGINCDVRKSEFGEFVCEVMVQDIVEGLAETVDMERSLRGPRVHDWVEPLVFTEEEDAHLEATEALMGEILRTQQNGWRIKWTFVQGGD